MSINLRTAQCVALENFRQLIATQAELHCAELCHEMRSSTEKMRYETSRSGFERIDSVRYSAALMIDAQSRMIAATRQGHRDP
ncbi:MAG: hypothetical protein ACFCUJ_08035 [Thiotrichales bacterium]